MRWRSDGGHGERARRRYVRGLEEASSCVLSSIARTMMFLDIVSHVFHEGEQLQSASVKFEKQSTLERRGIRESQGCSRAQKFAGCRAPTALAAVHRNAGQLPQCQRRGDPPQPRGSCGAGNCACGCRRGEPGQRRGRRVMARTARARGRTRRPNVRVTRRGLRREGTRQVQL